MNFHSYAAYHLGALHVPQIEQHCMWHPLLAYAPTTHVTIDVQSNDLADDFIQSILEMRNITSDLSYKSQQYLQYHNAKFPSRPKLKQKYIRVLKSCSVIPQNHFRFHKEPFQ